MTGFARPVPRAAAALLAMVLGWASALAQTPPGELRIATHATMVPAWLDPSVAAGQYTAFILLYALHDALLKPMPDDPAAPSLAQSWSASPDGLSVEFRLRSGIVFHNGDPVTAEDVRFTFERYRIAATSPLKARLARIETPAPDRVRFVLKEPWPDFTAYLSTLIASAGWIVPKRYVEQVGDDGYLRNPIGAGPYRFVSFTPGVELVLEAFDRYWRKAPAVKRVVIKSVPDETTRVAMVKRGDADVAYVLSGALAQDVRDTPSLRLKPTYPPTILWLVFTDQADPKSPWHDVRVRQAANFALNRQAINEAFFLGQGRAATSVVPDDFKYAWKSPGYAFDPAAAKRLLAEAGYANGFEAGDLFTDTAFTNESEAILGDLAAVGIRARLRPLDRAAFFGQWAEKKLKGIVLGASGSPGEAWTRLGDYVAPGGRYAGEFDPEIAPLFAAQAAESDPAKRGAKLEELQRLLHDRAIFAPVVRLVAFMAIGPRVAESALDLIPGYAYTAPFEELRLNDR